MVIRHVAGVAEIVEDVAAAARFYREALGLPVKHEEGASYAEVEIPGVLHFGLWARRAAAETTLGDPDKADQIPLGLTLGFEVDAVEETSRAFENGGGTLLHEAKTEPWGQTTSRFISPGGALCEFSETPWARRITQGLQAGEEQA